MELNREQLVKALECCLDGTDCTPCPLLNEQSCPCVLNENALAIINELTEENERFKCVIKLLEADVKERDERLERNVAEIYPEFMKDYELMLTELKDIRADTVTELRDKLLARKVSYGNISFRVVPVDDIKAVCREMMEGEDG